MRTANPTRNTNLLLLRAGSLKPLEVLRAAEALKQFMRKHWRKQHEWVWKKLGIPRRKFYRFLAIGKWSNKCKEIVRKNSTCLSQTALFRLAETRRTSARKMVAKITALADYLKFRKRALLKRLAKKLDPVGAFLAAQKVAAPKKKYLAMFYMNGHPTKVETFNPESLERSMERVPGYGGFMKVVRV